MPFLDQGTVIHMQVIAFVKLIWIIIIIFFLEVKFFLKIFISS